VLRPLCFDIVQEGSKRTLDAGDVGNRAINTDCNSNLRSGVSALDWVKSMTADNLEQVSFPTLEKAPITEALIDIRVQLPDDVGLDTLRAFQGLVAPRFPQMDERYSVEAQIQVNKEEGAKLTSTPPSPDGFLLSSDSEPVRVQVRRDGFTVHRLRPYNRWSDFSGDAKSLWQQYKALARPIKVTRLEVRYINRLELAPDHDFADYILTAPEVAPALPQGLADYFMRLVIPHESGSLAVITESTLPRDPEASAYPIILDIDVFRDVDLPVDDLEVWSIMEELRGYKNLIFFNSLTPAFLETLK
jgi:uncharacterized protein (TIGR04255 family)